MKAMPAPANLAAMAKKRADGSPPEPEETEEPGTPETERVMAAVADVLGQLSEEERSALGAFADSVSEFPFPDDHYAETRKQIAEIEDRLKQEIEASGGDTELVTCRASLRMAGVTGLDELSREEILARYKEHYPDGE
jgi:hypothetical protein